MAKKRRAATALSTESTRHVRPVKTYDGAAAKGVPAGGLCAMELPMGQAALMSGDALLSVTDGCLWVHGLLVKAGQPPVRVCADERVGGALSLEATCVDVQVPLSRQQPVAFELRRADACVSAVLGAAGPGAGGLQPRDAANAAGSASDATPEGGLVPSGFQLWRASDAAAPAANPIPGVWREAADGIAAASMALVAAGRRGAVVAVCGSKGTGKSTFARLLVNALLSHGSDCVAFLDVDCGQPEFTVPGVLSAHLLRAPLLGPPHLHPREPDAARFVGDTSPQADPAAYVAASQAMAAWLRGHAGDAPMVVNTPGWVKGLGFEALSEVLAAAQPSHAVLMQAPAARRNLPPEPFWLPPPPLGALPPPPPIIVQLPAAAAPTPGANTATGARRASAVESRALAWTAFVRRCLHAPPAGFAGSEALSAPHAASGGAGWDAEAQAAAVAALAAQPPYVACLNDLDVMHGEVPAHLLAHALNGAVVGLAAAAAPQAHGEEAGAPGSAPGCSSGLGLGLGVDDALGPGHRFRPLQRSCGVADWAQDVGCAGLGLGSGSGAPSTDLECLGVGVVRSVDMAARRVYLLSPLRADELERVTTLQVGRLELPPELLQAGAFASPYLSIGSMAAGGTGAGVIKSRNNLLRAAQAG